MPLHKSWSVILLVVLGACFALGNLWYAAVRSAIPLELKGEVTKKVRGIEKTPGVDDVYIVTIDDQKRIQLDRATYEVMVLNRPVTKTAWSRVLRVDDEPMDLSWSSDFYGMLWITSVSILFLLALGRSGIRWRDTTALEPSRLS